MYVCTYIATCSYYVSKHMYVFVACLYAHVYTWKICVYIEKVRYVLYIRVIYMTVSYGVQLSCEEELCYTSKSDGIQSSKRNTL